MGFAEHQCCMKPEGPKLPAVRFVPLDHVGLVTHPWTDVVSEGNIVRKDAHVWAALQSARDIIPQRPECNYCHHWHAVALLFTRPGVQSLK